MARRRPSVAVLLVAYWMAQALMAYAGTVLWMGLAPEREGEILGNPLRAEVLEVALDPEVLLFVTIVIGVITVAQGVFLLPLRRPGLTAAHGRSLRLSLIAAGFGIGVLLLASVLALISVVDLVWDEGSWARSDAGAGILEAVDRTPGGEFTILAAIFLISWIVPTMLLIAFARAGRRRERVAARLASGLLIGTAAEVCLLIPLDVMVRRKSDCYCGEGTFFALTLAGWVGMLGLGPAVFAPLIARRRRRWYAAHCPACGYDMTGVPDADRCPECGLGWRPAAPGPREPQNALQDTRSGL